jgi:hypothetical protein
MALFGAPIAHEDHARHAVLAALGIAARAEVPVRIGINSGLVVVGRSVMTCGWITLRSAREATQRTAPGLYRFKLVAYYLTWVFKVSPRQLGSTR